MRTLTSVMLTLLCILTITGSASTGASAQEVPDANSLTFKSQLTNMTVDLGPSGEGQFVPEFYIAPYSFRSDGGQSQLEGIWIRYMDTRFAIGIAQGPVGAIEWSQNNLDRYSSGYEYANLLGQEFDADYSWLLIESSAAYNIEVVSFTGFQHQAIDDVHFMITTYGPLDEAAPALNWLEQNVTIGGTELTVGPSSSDISAMVDGTSDIEPVVLEMEMTTVADWEREGLHSDSEWESVVHGTNVQWETDAFHFPFYDQNAISHPGKDEDLLSLRSNDHNSTVSVRILPNTGGDSLSFWSEYWTSEDYLESYGYEATIIDQQSNASASSLIFTRLTTNYTPIVSVHEVRMLPDDSILTVSVESTEPHIVDAYVGTMKNISVDGDQLASSYTEADLNQLVYGTEESSSDAAESGDSSWVSPTTGTAFWWHEQLFLMENGEGNILSLETIAGDGQVHLSTSNAEHSIGEWMQLMSSQDWPGYSRFAESDHEVLTRFEAPFTGSVIFLHQVDGQDVITIIDVFPMENGVTIITEITAAPENISDTYGAFTDGVQAEDGYYLVTWKDEDVKPFEFFEQD